jgi:hypothetical protein
VNKVKEIDNPVERAQQWVRRFIWLYFWLLLAEGALRKWVLPSYSNPLLLIRDPVALAIYMYAIPGRVFPRNGWMFALCAIAFLSLAITFAQLWLYFPPFMIASVAGYGFHANFFHLPLIFIMAKVLRPEDVKRFGWWILALMVPMAVLMVAQFRAAPDAFLNRTAGGEGEMMLSALGKVRTAGPFSFVVGVVAYFSMATGYLVWAVLRRTIYKNWLLAGAGSALGIGIAVSGSRSVVGACVVVVASLVIVLFLRPDAVNRFGQTLVVVAILALIVSQTPIFKEGLNVLTTRFNEVAEATDQSVAVGLVERFFGSFEDGLFVLTKAPFLGYGLGIGTNAGAKFLTGRSGFLLTEGEWSRTFLEMGPVLGLAYVVWRVALVVWVGLLCIRSVRLGNVLPLLLFSSSFLPMISGQFGQPTILGFSVFVTGLALAARNEEELIVSASSASSHPRAVAPVKAIPTRSIHAVGLRRSNSESSQTNGSADR